MKLLITGTNGFLGQHITTYFSSKNYAITGAGRGTCRLPEKTAFEYYQVDFTNEAEVILMIALVKPDVVIHTAASSSPDTCNSDKNNCLLQNVEATKYLLNASPRIKAPHFIFISTDFIFGENGPHGEEDQPCPLNFYGESKLMAEKLVVESLLPFTIIRPVFIYGQVWSGLRPSFLHWVKNKLEQHERIKIVSDQMRTPTYVVDICKGIETIITKGKYGVYHLAGKDIISPYQMAVDTANVLGLDATLIENVTSGTFKEIVKRPLRSGLKIDKSIRELDYKPVSFIDGVKLTFNIY